MRVTLVPLAVLALGASAIAETRDWTNAQGRKITADFVSQTAAKVTLRLKDGKEVSVDKSTLSKADQDYLKSAGAGTPAPAAATAPSGASSRVIGFNEVKIDKKTWNRPSPPKDIKITAADFIHQIETEHFFIAGTTKVKPEIMDSFAEACERLYVHLVKDIPATAKLFDGGKRMSIWLTENETVHDKFGEFLNKQEGTSVPYTWNRSSIVHITFGSSYADQQKFLKLSRCFRADAKENFRNIKSASRLHFITSELFNGVLDGVEANGDYNFGLLRLGHSYYVEGDICGNITTEITFTSGGNVEGFKNGRAWPTAIKNLLKNPNVKPGLEKMLKTDMTKAEPMDLGAAFGFFHWCFHDPARGKAFNEVLAAAAADKKVPAPDAFAKKFGFDNAAAFDAAFVAYLKSDAFK